MHLKNRKEKRNKHDNILKLKSLVSKKKSGLLDLSTFLLFDLKYYKEPKLDYKLKSYFCT